MNPSSSLPPAGAGAEGKRLPKMIHIDRLQDTFPDRHAKRVLHSRFRSKVPYCNIVEDDKEGIVVKTILKSDEYAVDEPAMFARCGPRRELFFQPEKVTAAIVTCGGLCPGLNSVIRDITHALHELYGAKRVLGFVGGYPGIYMRAPVELTEQNTKGIQHLGGTILSSGRGGFDAQRILDKLDELEVDQLFVVGGDGSMRGASKLAIAAGKRTRPIAILGVPKTIDNDIAVIDRSFGFDSAVEETLRAVRSAQVEASCLINGVGIVQVMGRSAGFIASHVTLASGDVDLCLIPEVPIVYDGGEHCVFAHLSRVVREKGSAVVVLAEGAGEEILGRSAITDAGGNRKLPEIGPWIKSTTLTALKENGITGGATVKFIDPSYMVRSGAANGADSQYCLSLSQGVVHAAMAGLTNCCAGLVHNRNVLIPLDWIVRDSPRGVDPLGWTWERVVDTTGQPFQRTAPCKL